MKNYIETLEIEFQKNSDPNIAKGQKQYLKDQFECYGLKTPFRRQLQKPFLEKAYLPSQQDLVQIVKRLWQKPQREFHYFAQELTYKYHKKVQPQDIILYEFMITHQSWWDTVDFIATKLVSNYFKVYPDQIPIYIERWNTSSHLWLQRTAIIFQLHYKKDVDTHLLQDIILKHLGSREFFINKAIGWMLRNYSRTNPEWVIDFVDTHELHPLSKREALRLLK